MKAATYNEKMQALRNGAGLTLQVLSKKIGTTPQFVMNMERGFGMIPPAKLKKYAKAVKIPLEVVVEISLDEIARKFLEKVK